MKGVLIKMNNYNNNGKVDRAVAWDQYLQYLRGWADSHSEAGFCGTTPACFDEWYDCEYKGEDKGDTDTDYSGSFEVTISETLQKVVTVDADSSDEAEQTVSDNWRAGDYILNADDFIGVEFNAVPA
jgi:hypothetical protein